MSLPIYHHPSLTVLVDDSDSFLKSLAFQLDPALASVAFQDTSSALAWLNRPDDRSHARLSASFDAYPRSWQQRNVTVDVAQIHRISFERQRFMTPSVLVVDYSMPQMNGVELCAALRHLPCKKILFTGAADEKVAVDAFNKGLIDRYIKKSDDGALDQLEAEIVALQAEYFAARSQPLRELLALHDHAFVSDPTFCAVVRGVLAQQRIVEHYLYPDPSGILMYDADGHAQLMVVETESSLQSHYEVACDDHAPDSLLDALRERRIIPWFRDGDGMYAASFARNWHKYIQPAQPCVGTQNYYWALFRLEPGELAEPAHPFARFMREREQF